MSPTIQLEIWKRFEPSATLQTTATRRIARATRDSDAGEGGPAGRSAIRGGGGKAREGLQAWGAAIPAVGKAGRPAGQASGAEAGRLGRFWRLRPTPVPATMNAGIVTWLKRKGLLKEAATQNARKEARRPVSSQPRRRFIPSSV